ncbi:MAG: 16S rRNA (guanine(966)-N(2))-methyltransferase RsmD [Porticoccaceae bacterium]|nr:16S rRNA (guanine(966)-N(2))-methyltransferase RsmD [Porticoccaceae bacterium]
MPRKQTQGPSAQKLRIIAGKWRSRVVAFQPADGLRPTGDRIRETAFNWLRESIDGARCIDLFAGSGALSFEALSRGAAHCTSLEQQGAAIKQLRENAALLQAQDLDIVHTDSLRYLQQGAPAQPYNLAFVDPPFAAGIINNTCVLLNNNSWLADKAMIYCEMAATDNSFVAPENWQMLREKVSGEVRYCLYSRIEPKL